VIVEAVDHPGRLAGREPDPGGIDLPEIVRERPLEALARLRPSRRLGSDETVALERAMDLRDRRRLAAGPGKLGMDPARAPARVSLA
jgi:hypothetical protein